MTKHAQKASELFRQGYNCAQSVFAAFCDETGYDLESALKISSSFGGGIGRLREVCGAVSGACMVAGVKYGYTSSNDDVKKAEHYALIQDIAGRFKEKSSTIICRELLDLSERHSLPIPEARTKEYYKFRPCERFVVEAAEIMDDIINEKASVKK